MTSDLQDALRQCRSELADLREAHESCLEKIAAGERAVHDVQELSSILADRLSREETAVSGLKGWLRRRVQPNAASEQELADAAELRAASLFDGAWYLRMYPEVVSTGESPALHYLRRGADEGKDPGPDFSTSHYLAAHPLLARRRANPLLNHLRTGQ